MNLHKQAVLSSIENINQSYFTLTVEDKEVAELSQAGLFCQIRPRSSSFPRLRKPISIYDVDGDHIRFMIKRIGAGTQGFAQLRSGDAIDLIGPLGKGFTVPAGRRIILISGGIGYPPLFFLNKRLKDAGNETFWLHGGNCSDDLFPCAELWCRDGSSGNAGLVSEGLAKRLPDHQYDLAYACGPIPLLKACHQICQQACIPLQVSMEAYMACGIGVCHGCAVPVWERGEPVYRNVCSDGPVFDAALIRWEEL